MAIMPIVVLFLGSGAWAHGGAAPAAGHVELPATHVGELMLTGHVEGAERPEIELNLARMLSPPDPLLGAEAPVVGASVIVAVWQGATERVADVAATPAGPAGAYAVSIPSLPRGQYTLRVTVGIPGGPPPVTAELPFDLGEPAVHAEGGHEPTGHHAMTHPFLSHMGIPDGPGEVSVRVSPIRRASGAEQGSDLALHVEAGIVPRLGLHLRNDAVTGAAAMEPGHGTELMVMFAVAQDEAMTRGVSVFGELSAPTVPGDEPVTYGVGIGGRWMGGTRVLLDGIVHVEPEEGFAGVGMAYTASAVVRVAGKVFVLVEDNGELSAMETSNYLTPSVKVGLGDSGGTVGFGLSVPLMEERAYDRQLLFQLDWAFG